MNGIYAGYFTGKVGSGFAMFVLKDGVLTGADVTGVLFDGEYKAADTKAVTGILHAKIPPGTTTIQGVTAGERGLNYSAPFSLPANFESEPYVTVETPLGTVNVRLVKLREIQ